MECIKLAKKLQGLHTVETITKKLGITRSTAIKYVHFLKKQGFVQKSGGGKQKRLYRISLVKNRKTGTSLYEIINRNSKIKLIVSCDYIIHRKVSIEEALVRGVASREYRIVLASIGLFQKVKNWSRLYQYAIKHNVVVFIGALYDVAKQIMRVKKMDQRTFKAILRHRSVPGYIIENVHSKDFQPIERYWKVYIPFNLADLREYRWTR